MSGFYRSEAKLFNRNPANLLLSCGIRTKELCTAHFAINCLHLFTDVP